MRFTGIVFGLAGLAIIGASMLLLLPKIILGLGIVIAVIGTALIIGSYDGGPNFPS